MGLKAFTTCALAWSTRQRSGTYTESTPRVAGHSGCWSGLRSSRQCFLSRASRFSLQAMFSAIRCPKWLLGSADLLHNSEKVSMTVAKQRISSMTTPQLQASAALPLYSGSVRTSGATKGMVPHTERHITCRPSVTARSKPCNFSKGSGSSGVSTRVKFSGLRSLWQIPGPSCTWAMTENIWMMMEQIFSGERYCLSLSTGPSRLLSRWKRFTLPQNSMRKVMCVLEW
mmetsp:Transcript_114958/g.279018  ORF Transcript_114958/g.279018 Transcript_114958/m.279018 type:complete len:228 (-) Transcript_114958:892-1575(-)